MKIFFRTVGWNETKFGSGNSYAVVLELSFFDCLLVLQVELILCIKWLKAIPDLVLEEVKMWRCSLC
jgi:hypothetical protein